MPYPLENRAENIEQAIESYQQVLTVRTQTAMLVAWITAAVEREAIPLPDAG